MHELRIAEDLSAIVTEAAFEEGMSRITAVNICFGELVQIEEECFTLAFSESVKGTVAEGSELHIEIIPVKAACNSCRAEYLIDDLNFICHSCGSSDLEITAGKELFIKSIEGE